MVAFQSRVALVISAFVALYLGSVSPASATSPEASEQFKRANALFQQQKFEEAAAEYQALVKQVGRTPVLLYNLGTAAARAGDFPEAYGYLLAAHRLAPRNEAIRVNLGKVEESLYPDERKRPTPDHWREISTFLTAAEWTMVYFSMVLIASVAYLLAQWKRTGSIGEFLKATAGALCGAVLISSPLAATSIYYNWVRKEALVVRGSQVRSGPDERFAVIETAQPATRVRVLGHAENGFQNVKTESGRVGYITEESLEAI